MSKASSWSIDSNIRNFLDVSLVGSSIVDPAGKIVYANKSLIELFNTSQESFVGRVASDFYADPNERFDIISDLRAKNFVKDLTVRLKRDNGPEFSASLSFVLSEYAGEDHYFCLFYDLTDRLVIEEQLKIQVAKELRIQHLEKFLELGNKTADKINNPLNIINGLYDVINDELQKETIDIEKIKSLTEKVKHSINRIAGTVKELNQITSEN